MPYRCVYCVAPVLLLLSCSTVRLPSDVTMPVGIIATPVRYSIVFVIHGDGNYRYHDTRGGSHRADDMALDSAREIAMLNPDAEVFIFHEQRRPGFLKRIFSRHDATFYYYRYGRLLAFESYRRLRTSERFDAAAALHERFQAPRAADQTRIFFFLGHEIPEYRGAGYDASHPRTSFTVDDLAGGLMRWSRTSSRFDLLVLATCYGGTPHTVATLSPYARFIVASPENLHLAYYDLQPFQHLSLGQSTEDVGDFAVRFAEHAFLRLSDDVQTAVTVALYDVERVASYVTAVGSAYRLALADSARTADSLAVPIDCAESAFAWPGMRDGVTLFYRPAQFGRARSKKDHSGWVCRAM
jgi:Clostripain family